MPKAAIETIRNIRILLTRGLLFGFCWVMVYYLKY